MSKKTRKQFLRKVEKKKQIRATYSGRNLTNKELDKVNNLDKELVKYLKKDIKRDKAKKRHVDKINYLNKNLIDTRKLKYKEIDQLRVKDMINNSFNLLKYPQYKKAAICDMYRRMEFLPGTRLYVAYQDYCGENSFEYILNEFKQYQATELLSFLKDIVYKPLTAVKGVPGTSGGQAGTAIWSLSPKAVLWDEYVRVSSTNRHINSKRSKKSRVKVSDDSKRGYQRLKNNEGKVTYNKMSAYDLLVLINALMYNIVEGEREELYQRFYGSIEENAMGNEDDNWMDFFVLLPKPNYWG